MGLNVTFLKDALHNAISTDTSLSTAVNAGSVDTRTGQVRESIFESEPNFTGVVPAITYTILDVEPMVSSSPTIGIFKSPIIIFGVGSNQEEANYLGDLIQSFFAEIPTGEDTTMWFRNITTDCLANKSTRFLSRLRSGRQGISRNDYKAETVADAVEIEIIWHTCNCETSQECDIVLPTECELEYDETYNGNSCH
tara:strand:- start:33577 stop:34164 length:588 start_codon:yes stop_codon:yes gene_type:complete